MLGFHKDLPKPQSRTLRTSHEQRFADLGIPIPFISVPPKGLFCVAKSIIPNNVPPPLLCSDDKIYFTDFTVKIG